MKFIKTYKAGIKDLPFLLLVIDLIWWVLSLFGIWSFDYWYVLELTSHSLVFVLYMAFYALVHRYCLYSWACIIGLGLINILNTLHFFCSFEYIKIYVGIIISTCLTFALIKWKKRYFSYLK